MRYAGVLISGALAGLGGAWLAIDIRAYNQDQVAGRGFQGLAALIFGNWQPAGVGAGAGLFAFGQSLTFTTNEAVLALFLLAALAFTGVAVVPHRSAARLPQALGLFIIGVLTFLYYQATSQVDSRIVYMTPYVVTLLVLTFASQRLPTARGRRPAVVQGPERVTPGGASTGRRSRSAAIDAATQAYAAYSHFHVGRRRPGRTTAAS